MTKTSRAAITNAIAVLSGLLMMPSSMLWFAEPSICTCGKRRADIAHPNARLAELGVDSRRIAVGGERAGGGHACLTLAIHARGEIPLIYQLAHLFRCLDDRTGIEPDRSRSTQHV